MKADTPIALHAIGDKRRVLKTKHKTEAHRKRKSYLYTLMKTTTM